MKVAYITSRFPNLTETFVLYEMVAVERQGVATSIYPLLRTRQKVVHAEARELVRRAHYHPFLSLRILRANWRWFLRSPRRYLGTLAEILRGTWGSANFFIGALGIFPKSARFACEMLEEGVTHVHAHFSNHPAVAALIVHRLTGIPFSFTAHGHDIHVERRMLEEKIDAAAFCVMISSYNERLVTEHCPEADRKKLHVIHCGADTTVFAPRPEPRTDPRFVILCVGSFIEVKGHAHLVAAAHILRERGHEIVCHMVGGGPGRRDIEKQIADAGLESSFVLHGPLPRSGVAELMRRADAIVQPSVPTSRGAREGIPVSLMEGMASGLAVVASDLSGIPELVLDGATGILVPPGEDVPLADGIERLIRDNELRRRMGKAGRERVLARFDLDRNASRLIELFRRAAAPSSPPEPIRAER